MADSSDDEIVRKRSADPEQILLDDFLDVNYEYTKSEGNNTTFSTDQVVYMLQVPKNFEIDSLLKSKINLGGKTKFKNESGEKFIIQAEQEEVCPTLVLSDRVYKLPCHGRLVMEKDFSLKKQIGVEIPAKTKVPLPVQLSKTRHPLLGADYETKMNVNGAVRRKLREAIENLQKCERSALKKKKKVAESRTDEEKELLFILLGQKNVNGYESGKKVKKEDGAAEGLEESFEERKPKKEKNVARTDFYEISIDINDTRHWPAEENPLTQENNNIGWRDELEHEDEEVVGKKKKKGRSSREPTLVHEAEVDERELIHESVTKKKKKREKEFSNNDSRVTSPEESMSDSGSKSKGKNNNRDPSRDELVNGNGGIWNKKLEKYNMSQYESIPEKNNEILEGDEAIRAGKMKKKTTKLRQKDEIASISKLLGQVIDGCLSDAEADRVSVKKERKNRSGSHSVDVYSASALDCSLRQNSTTTGLPNKWDISTDEVEQSGDEIKKKKKKKKGGSPSKQTTHEASEDTLKNNKKKYPTNNEFVKENSPSKNSETAAQNPPYQYQEPASIKGKKSDLNSSSRRSNAGNEIAGPVDDFELKKKKIKKEKFNKDETISSILADVCQRLLSPDKKSGVDSRAKKIKKEKLAQDDPRPIPAARENAVSNGEHLGDPREGDGEEKVRSRKRKIDRDSAQNEPPVKKIKTEKVMPDLSIVKKEKPETSGRGYDLAEMLENNLLKLVKKRKKIKTEDK